jgi:hypothetical protein
MNNKNAVKPFKTLGAGMVSLALAGPALVHGAEKSNEVSLFGNITYTPASGGQGSSTSGTVAGSYGWYLSPTVVLGLQVLDNISKSSGSGGGTTNLFGVGPTLKVYFSESAAKKVAPYGRVQAGYYGESGSGTTVNGYEAQAFVGFDVGLTEAASIFAEAGYQRTSLSIGGTTLSTNNAAFNVGLTFRF